MLAMMISIKVPDNAVIPNEIKSFSDNENLIMILVGIKAVKTMKYNDMSEEMMKMRNQYDVMLDSKNNEIQIMKRVFDEIILEDRNKNDISMKNKLVVEKEEMSRDYNDVILKYNTDCSQYREKIVELNKSILDSKTELYLIEKDIKHNNEINELRIENEIIRKMKQKEDEKNTTGDF